MCAQQPGKLPTMGIIGSGTPATQSHWYAAFVQRLRELGWIDGRSVAVEYRWAEGRDERFAEIAADGCAKASTQPCCSCRPLRAR
jgi:putative ABC transport system substrate-binding protein